MRIIFISYPFAYINFSFYFCVTFRNVFRNVFRNTFAKITRKFVTYKEILR
nr:MAG TPA: hypothetical protein [Caudoviricetes sp.]